MQSPIEIRLKAPTIIFDGDVQITGSNEIAGSCAHASCSCDGSGGSGIGTGSQELIAHGLVDENGDPAVPGECSAFCTDSGGTCAIVYCDDTYICITCTSGVSYRWKVKR